MKIQRRVLISGRVQGVSFRASLQDEVKSRDPTILGSVKNLEDGRVEAVLQGEESTVLALVRWCTHGPSHAKVERLEVIEETPALGLSPFTIRP